MLGRDLVQCVEQVGRDAHVVSVLERATALVGSVLYGVAVHRVSVIGRVVMWLCMRVDMFRHLIFEYLPQKELSRLDGSESVDVTTGEDRSCDVISDLLLGRIPVAGCASSPSSPTMEKGEDKTLSSSSSSSSPTMNIVDRLEAAIRRAQSCQCSDSGSEKSGVDGHGVDEEASRRIAVQAS
jgi:hypothetical protein